MKSPMTIIDAPTLLTIIEVILSKQFTNNLPKKVLSVSVAAIDY
jgi:hypothetical protein